MSHIIDTNLSNGIRVLIDPGSSAGMASIGMAFNIGASYETEQENGISHILEHNMFGGTDKHTANEIQDRAADMGADMNAYTNRDETNYHLTAMSDQAESMIDLLADMLTCSVFPSEKFETERSAILQEIKMCDDNPHRAGGDALQKMMYPNQPLGRNIIGPAENVSAIGRDQMISFFTENYNTSTMIVTVAGDVDPSRILSCLDSRLNMIPFGVRRDYKIPVLGNPAYHHVERHDMDQTLAILCYPAFADSDHRKPSMQMASRILGNGMESHLLREVRGKHGLVYDIGSNIGAGPMTGVFQIKFGCDESNVPQTAQILKETLENFVSTVTDNELLRAKRKFKTHVALFNESVENRMTDNLSYTVLRGRPVSPKEEIEEVESVTLHDVRNVFSKVVKQIPFIVTVGKQSMYQPFAKFGL